MNKICPAYGIQMGTILGQISVHFIKMGAFLFGISVHFSEVGTFFRQNVCTLGHKFVPEPSIMSKIHRELPRDLNLTSEEKSLSSRYTAN